MNNKIHNTAIIDTGAKIGKNTYIWHWSHICSDANIGNDCTIGQNVYVAKNVLIGNNCKIQNNVSLYEGVILEDNIFCGPSVVFTNVINPRTIVNRKNEFKQTLIKTGSSLGANCTILPGIKLEKFSFIGAGAVVTKNTKAYGLYVGNPAKQVGWISREGYKLNLPMEGSGKIICDISGNNYYVNNGFCYNDKD